MEASIQEPLPLPPQHRLPVGVGRRGVDPTKNGSIDVRDRQQSRGRSRGAAQRGSAGTDARPASRPVPHIVRRELRAADLGELGVRRSGAVRRASARVKGWASRPDSSTAYSSSCEQSIMTTIIRTTIDRFVTVAMPPLENTLSSPKHRPTAGTAPI